MTENKNHWYDGWFYDVVIAPNQDNLFSQLKDLVEEGSDVIDVGCGTGRLEFALAGKCHSLLGIDLSERNIAMANMRLSQNPDAGISFFHKRVEDIERETKSHFDYAILTYVIHEVNEEERISLIKDIARIADKIIISDYHVPRPGGFAGFLSKSIEFIAGPEHYRNYKSFMAKGGIYYLSEKIGLIIQKEILNNPGINHIVVLSK
jgi:SAM-dependent methyltransferase